ncbi:MAG: hypothetical protein V3U76_08170 [Granulosicoccus sp.]
MKNVSNNIPNTACLDLWSGFQPAFAHRQTGETHLSQTAQGQLSDTHSFACLPEHWVVEWDGNGEAIALHPEVVAGYWRYCRFISLCNLENIAVDA